MNVEIKEQARRYHVSFEQDKSTPQTVTTCKIFLSTALVGSGTTTLSCKDTAGFKIALTRALDDAKLGKYANALFWQEFQLRHCKTFANVDGLPHKFIDSGAVCQHKIKAKGGGTDWCTKYKSGCEQQCETESVPGYGGHISFQRRAVKEQQLYSGDYPNHVRKIIKSWPEWKRNIRPFVRDKIKDSLTDNIRRITLQGAWGVVNLELTARMGLMSLAAGDEFKKLDAELLSRAGVTKVHDEYIINPDEFVSPFEVGEVVTFENEAVNIIGIAGPTLTIQPILWWSRFREIWTGTMGWIVMDWEVEKRLHWLRRVGRTVAKWWSETATATDKEAKKGRSRT